jgi:hypothetical protein
MTSGWILINIALAVAATAIVAGAAILVPHRLHRHAMRHDAAYARYHDALVAPAARPAAQRRAPSSQRRVHAA